MSRAPTTDLEEREPLVARPSGATQSSLSSIYRTKRARWRASPLWIAPAVFTANLVRGMTTAPRVDVYTSIACSSLKLEETPNLLVPLAVTLSSTHWQQPRTYETLMLNYSANSTIVTPYDSSYFDECAADPAEVQGRAARIQASVKTTESVLSALTTGWISYQSDIYGRKKLLMVSVLGIFLVELAYIAVSGPGTILSRHGETFIIFASVVEGLLGAHLTFNSLVHAYLSDCSGDGTRSRTFSMMQGILFTGLAAGPWLDGAVFKFSRSSNQILFTLAATFTLIHLLFIMFLLPESLLLKPSLSSQPPLHESSTPSRSYEQAVSGQGPLRKIAHFLYTLLVKPVAILSPHRLKGERGYDWNLTMVGFSSFMHTASAQVVSIKLLYVKHIYDWNSEYLGYYLSLLWVLRALNLFVILPAILTHFTPISLLDRGRSTSATHLASAIGFDRTVATISFSIDALALVFVVLSPSSSPALFVFFTALTSFTSGGGPALHSLGAASLKAMGRDEVGLVFGAMSLVNSVAHIVSPGLYAWIYAATVESFPKATFLLSAMLIYLASASLLAVRPYAQSRRAGSERVYESVPGNGDGGARDEGRVVGGT